MMLVEFSADRQEAPRVHSRNRMEKGCVGDQSKDPHCTVEFMRRDSELAERRGAAAILSKELRLPAWRGRWSVIDTSLLPVWNSMPHVVSHGLAALFLVVPDQVAELFDPIDVLSELPEVIQENLPEHADVPCGCLKLAVFRERLPSLSTFYLWHVLQPSLRFSSRAQACSTAAVGSTPARTE